MYTQTYIHMLTYTNTDIPKTHIHKNTQIKKIRTHIIDTHTHRYTHRHTHRNINICTYAHVHT